MKFDRRLSDDNKSKAFGKSKVQTLSSSSLHLFFEIAAELREGSTTLVVIAGGARGHEVLNRVDFSTRREKVSHRDRVDVIDAKSGWSLSTVPATTAEAGFDDRASRLRDMTSHPGPTMIFAGFGKSTPTGRHR